MRANAVSKRTDRDAVEEMKRRGDPHEDGARLPVTRICEHEQTGQLGTNGTPRSRGADWRRDRCGLAAPPQQAAQEATCAEWVCAVGSSDAF